MNTTPKISIIVPVYKAEKYLSECLDSILAQTLSDFELILVNDGSPDNSGKICESYALKDTRIKVIHKKNGGACTARKAGLEAAIGQYIGWVDADDSVAQDMFSVLYSLIEGYKADIVECQYFKVNGNNITRSGKDEPVVSGSGDFILGEFFGARMTPNFWSKLYRPELFEKIQFPDRQLHVDFYVNVQFALMPLKYVRTSATKYYYMIRENSNITTYNAKAIREAIYKYDYTMSIAATVESELAKKYLQRDAINRLMRRYFEVTVNSNLKDQNVYSTYIRKKLGFSVVRYLLLHGLPIKTRVNYALLLLNLKEVQVKLHNYFGKK